MAIAVRKISPTVSKLSFVSNPICTGGRLSGEIVSAVSGAKCRRRRFIVEGIAPREGKRFPLRKICYADVAGMAARPAGPQAGESIQGVESIHRAMTGRGAGKCEIVPADATGNF